MKEPLLLCILLFSLSIIHAQKANEERKKSIDEVYKRLNLTLNKKRILDEYEEYPNYEEYGEINYNPNKIREIIEEYGFRDTYNFVEAVNAPKHIKDQADCGSCWAFSSTTALAYRYFKKTKMDINLSPQYLLSCSGLSCEDGGFILDTQFMLVNVGTVTDECMPYTSADGVTIEECPTECPTDGVNFVKYKTKNAYSTAFDVEKNYYDVVAVIMDQLVNKGPVVTGISAYDDFSALMEDEDCPNIIYRHNGKGESSGHAVVIVGYGYEETENRYYWIIQNSWGEQFCDGGFVKIEFGQVDVERVAFSEAYIENEDVGGKQISLTLNLDEECFIKYTSENDDYDNSFVINFKGEDDSNFYYQCNKAPSIYDYKGICSFSFESVNNNLAGNYEFFNYEPLHKSNQFNFNFSWKEKGQFYYYGYIYIYGIMSDRFYVSEKDSKIFLGYEPAPGDITLPKIYLNKNEDSFLNNCEVINFMGQYGIECSMNQNELNHFNGEDNLPLAYITLCGQKAESDVSVYLLDKANYPVIRVNTFILPGSDVKKINQFNNIFTIIADIEGNISGLSDDNYFSSFIQIKKGRQNYELMIYCEVPVKLKLKKNFEIKCVLEDDENFDLSKNNYYDYIYLLPHYIPEYYSEPFEVIIKEKMQGIKYNEFNPNIIDNAKINDIYFIKYSLSFIFWVIIIILF